jgi:hypothetical protein
MFREIRITVVSYVLYLSLIPFEISIFISIAGKPRLKGSPIHLKVRGGRHGEFRVVMQTS